MWNNYIFFFQIEKDFETDFGLIDIKNFKCKIEDTFKFFDKFFYFFDNSKQEYKNKLSKDLNRSLKKEFFDICFNLKIKKCFEILQKFFENFHKIFYK